MKSKLMSIALLISMLAIPMMWYNQYHILHTVQATQLMWFFFWAGIPLTVILQILSKIIESIGGDK